MHRCQMSTESIPFHLSRDAQGWTVVTPEPRGVAVDTCIDVLSWLCSRR